jgi:glycosyltransferase involved in cell wall biosynthesis
MKILFRQFFGGKNHSWLWVGAGIATALKQMGCCVNIFSTDGTGYAPKELEENIIGYTQENGNQVFGRYPTEKYDAQIGYTCIKNFTAYFAHSDNKIGIWCYEWAGKNVLPTGFAKHHKAVNYLCPPSNFAKQVFIDSGIPEEKIKVIPHGINSDDYRKTDTIKLSTKSFKIISPIQQNHLRKNIPGMLDAYGRHSLIRTMCA